MRNYTINKNFFTTLLLLCISLVLNAQDEVYQTKENIPYYNEKINDADEYVKERCVLDVYYPKDVKNFPTIVWFHGGGLSAGNKFIPERLKGNGVAVIAVNYRLYPKIKAPVYIEDGAAAVAWTFKNIKEYGGDPSLIFISGHSAGGYLASMIGLDKRWLNAHEIDADKIAGLIPFSGHTITHFTVRKERDIEGTQPIIDDLAPLYHVRADAPPLLLITGNRELELLGRYEENAYMMRMMKLVGHEETQLMELDGYGHGMTEPAYPLLLKEVKRIAKIKGVSSIPHLDSNAPIQSFKVAGPFTKEGLSADDFQNLLDMEFVENESKLGDSSNSQILKSAKSNSKNILDFNKAVGESNYAIAYATFQISSDKNTEGLLRFRADDGAKIYVNGSVVYAANNRGWGGSRKHCSINLQKGINNVVFKIANRTHNWELEVEVLNKEKANAYLNELEAENEYLEFLSCVLKPRIDKEFSFTFYPGAFPDLVFDKPLLAKKHLGGSYSIKTKWFDTNLEECQYPKTSGRYAYYSEIKGKNGIVLKKSATLFCAPEDWMAWNERPLANLNYFPINKIPKYIWEQHQDAIEAYTGFGILKSMLLQKETPVLFAFLDEMNKQQLPASPLNTPLIFDGDFHAKLKQKILKVENKYPALKAPRAVSKRGTVLQKNTLNETNEKLYTDLKQICEDWINDSGSPFDVMIAKEGNILFHQAFGEDQYGKFTTQTPSEIASITKLLTGVLFAQFVDQGIIAIDDPVGKYLPEFPMTGPNALTLRHCFTHTNSFYGHGLFDGVHNPYLDNILALSISKETIGTNLHYNGMGYDLAGKVMEVVSGKSIFRLFREYLYDPLEMRHTVHDWDLGYSCHSTAADLAKVAQLLLNKGRYNGKEYFSSQTFEKIIPLDLNQFFPAINQKWGIGLTMMDWKVKDEASGKEKNLLSDQIIGHGSATASVLWVDLKNNIILTQSRRRGNENFGKHFQKMVETIEKYLANK